MQGLYSSSAGMMTHEDGLSIIGNNLANVNTIAFKQQLMLFQDVGYSSFSSGSFNATLEVSEVGYGSALGYTRTLFSNGALAEADNITDLALYGDGYFQVSDGENDYYTRAGNFYFDADGIMRSTGGYALTGIEIVNGVETGVLSEINLYANDGVLNTSPFFSTTEVTASLNLYDSIDSYSDDTNPYTAMLTSWNGLLDNPLSQSESITFQYYDMEGNLQDLDIYFDLVSNINGQTTYEYVVATDPSLDGRAGYAGTESAGLLQAGTMTFSSSGQLLNMSSFSPTGTDLTDPSSWTVSTLTNGLSSINVQLVGQEAQSISLNLGIQAGSDTWSSDFGTNMTMADIGSTYVNIPSMESPTYSSNATTALATSTSLKNMTQDGYPTGDLSSLDIATDGTVSASYTNGQTTDLYRIPIFRFTSEDGLSRSGDNLYAYTSEAGAIEYGTAGTENYASIYSGYLEQSNVDTATEMVNMIVVQRGFQSNSKSVQTIDTMIQKAIEMKRT